MPLQSWCCDSCRQPVALTGEGILACQITHKSIGSRDCDRGSDTHTHWWELSTVVGPAGLAELLSLVSSSPAGGNPARGVVDLDEYVTVIRRLHIPFYEEARTHFGHATRSWLASDGSDPRSPDTLEKIAAGHCRDE